MLEIGTRAPEFSLPDHNGKIRSLSDYRGKKVILYFYPADMSPGCTNQACSFRDMYPQIQEKGAVVLGVNGDSVYSRNIRADGARAPLKSCMRNDSRKIEIS